MGSTQSFAGFESLAGGVRLRSHGLVARCHRDLHVRHRHIGRIDNPDETARYRLVPVPPVADARDMCVSPPSRKTGITV